MFKKVIALVVYPLSLCVITLGVGLYFIWFTRKQKWGKIILTMGVGLILVFSLSLFSNALLCTLENKYPPLMHLHEIEGVKWIVVLGGGHTSNQKFPSNERLSSSSLSRLIEGIRIHNYLKNSKLVLSGGAVFDPIPEAITMADVASTLGVEQDDIILELDSKDTEEQAQNIRKLVTVNQIEKFILVTSALHMPRSIALFNKYGLHPIPAPTNFSAKKPTTQSLKSFFPSASALRDMERIFHEYLGLAWSRLKPTDK